jgi:hypothetical protein
VAEDAVLDDLRQRQLAILQNRQQPQRIVSPEERELREQRYAHNAASLSSVLSSILHAVNARKDHLPVEYSEKGLRDESAWYQALSELFYDMANVRKHSLYDFVGKSPQRKKDAMEVHRKARAVAEYYERQARNPAQFLQSTTALKLHELVVALENL